MATKESIRAGAVARNGRMCIVSAEMRLNMAEGKISKKQEEILAYIKQEILAKGYPPAVREICDAVHLKSTSSVHSHLETLEKNGFIRRDPTKPRAIEILDDDFNLARREIVNVPIVGQIAAGEPIFVFPHAPGGSA